MNIDETLREILNQFNREYQTSDRIQSIEEKIRNGAHEYAVAEDLAQEVGELLNKVLEAYLPEALTDGRLYRAAADVVLKQPMLRAAGPVRNAATGIQANINKRAGIGISPIVPEVNEDQVNGIVTGICNAKSYESGKATLFDQVENFFEGYVDDFVRENADFQYQAGLDPTVTRTAAAKCCKWCDQLAGTYEYERVRSKGNDVWKRHKNCRCVIDYDPGEKRNTRNRRSTDRDKVGRINFSKSVPTEHAYNTTDDPMREAFGSGELSHPKEIAGYRKEAAELAVEIIERDYESLAYSPGLTEGQPGVLYVSKGASYSAWSHEMQHMRDDHEAGWSGMRVMANADECYRREQRAYGVEIELAQNAGRQDLVNRLKNNLEAERRRIYGID